MPKTYLTQEDRTRHRLSAWVQQEKKTNKVTDKELGDEYGISQQGVNRKIQEKFIGNMDFEFFAFLVRKFGMDEETFHYIIGS